MELFHSEMLKAETIKIKFICVCYFNTVFCIPKEIKNNENCRLFHLPRFVSELTKRSSVSAVRLCALQSVPAGGI